MTLWLSSLIRNESNDNLSIINLWQQWWWVSQGQWCWARPLSNASFSFVFLKVRAYKTSIDPLCKIGCQSNWIQIEEMGNSFALMLFLWTEPVRFVTLYIEVGERREWDLLLVCILIWVLYFIPDLVALEREKKYTRIGGKYGDEHENDG